MAELKLSEQDLRQAMRAPRYWQHGQPEREAYHAWVSDAWRGLQGQRAEGGGRVEVRVRGYQRQRNGRTETVSNYTQSRDAADRRAAQAQGANEVATVGPEPGNAPPERSPDRSMAIIFIGGGADQKSRIVDRYREDAFNTAHNWLSPPTFAWDDARGVEAFIRGLPLGTRVRLVGHSYGGDTAAQVAARLGQAGRPVDMLVTIDPVGRGTSEAFFERVRDGARLWINVNATGGGSLDRSNMIAGFGGSWEFAPMGYAHEFLTAPVSHANLGGLMNARNSTQRSVAQEVIRR